MRDFQFQTPQTDQKSANRRLKTVSDLKRNVSKNAKKSLNHVFKADSEDDSAVLESPKEFSEASDDNPFSESVENFLALIHPTGTQSSTSVSVSDLSSTLSSSVTATPYKHDFFENACNKKRQVDSFKLAGSIEEEVVIKHLREARLQLLKSKDVGPSKNLVESLINIIIEEFHGGLYKEDEWLDKLMFRKTNLAFLICVMGLFSLLMVWFLGWSSTRSFTATGPTPT